MAADSFTDTDGTLISAHTAGGVTWSPMGAFTDTQGVIVSNQLSAGTEGFNVSCRASSSSADFSQVVFKAGDYEAESKAVHVRATSTHRGYYIFIAGDDHVGGVFPYLWLMKEGAILSGAPVALNRAVDNTVAIQAIQAGADVQLKGWLNGTPLVFNESLPGFEGPPSETFLDNDTPYPAGNPGISYEYNGTLTEANSRFDDWTDVQGGGGSTAVRARGMNGGFVDLSGGF